MKTIDKPEKTPTIHQIGIKIKNIGYSRTWNESIRGQLLYSIDNVDIPGIISTVERLKFQSAHATDDILDELSALVDSHILKDYTRWENIKLALISYLRKILKIHFPVYS